MVARRRIPRIAYVAHGVNGKHPGSAHVRVIRRARKALRDGDAWVVQLDVDAFIANAVDHEFDAILVQRDAVEPTKVEPLITAAKKRHIRLVAEIDDDLLSATAVERLIDQGYDPVRLERMQRLIRFADRVVVSTKPLAGIVSTVNRSVRVVPNVVDPELWTRLRTAHDVAEPREQLRVLYMGSSTHAEDAELLREPFERLIAEEAPIALETVGISERDEPWRERFDIPGDKTNYPAFVAWLLDNRDRWDLAVAPLAPTAFNEHKSDLKFLEYSMLGLPTVASDFGPYRGHGQHGLTLARTPDDWYSALRSVLAAPDALASAATTARSYVESERTLTDSGAWIRAILN